MKIQTALAALALMVALSVPKDSRAATPTVTELQRDYVGHRVYVNYSQVPCWHQTAQIRSVRAVEEKIPTRENALGEMVPLYEADPRVEFEITCPDGTVTAKHDLSIPGFVAEFERIPDPLTEEERQSSETKLKSYVGKTLYALQDTKFYPGTSSLAEIESGKFSFVLLRNWPLHVVAYKLWESARGPMALLELNTPAGDVFWVRPVRKDDGGLLDPIIGWQLATLPPTCWVPGEQKREVGVGATSAMARCNMGDPDKVNDYGRGEEQWIYQSEYETIYIYVQNDRVENIQRISR